MTKKKEDENASVSITPSRSKVTTKHNSLKKSSKKIASGKPNTENRTESTTEVTARLLAPCRSRYPALSRLLDASSPESRANSIEKLEKCRGNIYRKGMSFIEFIDWLAAGNSNETNSLPIIGVFKELKNNNDSERMAEKALASFRFAVNERIDVTRLRIGERMKGPDLSYSYLWTNRVALWFFFDSYLQALISLSKETSDELENQCRKILNLPSDHKFPHLIRNGKVVYGVDGKPLLNLNPFSKWEHAFFPIMNIWQPKIKAIVKKFTVQNSQDLRKDFLQEGFMAFRAALHKHAIHILGSGSKAEIATFDKKLKFGSLKQIRAILPDNTGAASIPMSNKSGRADVNNYQSFESIQRDFDEGD